VVSGIVKDQSLRPIGDIDADSLLGVGDGVANGVGQWHGAVGIAAGIRRGQFRSACPKSAKQGRGGFGWLSRWRGDKRQFGRDAASRRNLAQKRKQVCEV